MDLASSRINIVLSRPRIFNQLRLLYWTMTLLASIRPPQVVVLEEPNSRNWLTVNIKRIKPFNTATPTTLISSSNDGHYKVEEVLEEHTTNTGRHESKVKWVGYTNRHNSWVAEEDLHAKHLLEQFQ